MNHVRRRQFLLAAAGLLLVPTYGQAQKATKPFRVGVFGAGSAFQQSMNELGYVEGRDVVFEIRNPEGKSELFDPFALELVRLKVDVIVASTPNAVSSAKRATTTIPIVMMHTPDPVQLGFVASLARPGGNITGVTTLSADLSIKQLELLKAALPRMSRVALVWNPDNPWHPATVKALQDRSGSLGLQLQVLKVRGPDAFDGAFQAMTTERTQAVLVLADPMTFFNRRRLADLAIQHRLPMMGGLPDYAEAGSLMSYWADTTDVYRRAASYVDRILKGAKPGDLPIEQPTKFEIVANLKTARTLGITIPRSVLERADRVIE
ncbi:MAG TPA: ABC transporter substrate-binding protein [Casimicrobiaceae bacterium]|nr:ABC transporter substrate-binding protein [Casimicrobiaceae bacterium]